MPKKECWYNTLPCVEWATPGLFRILKRFLSPEADKQAQSKQHYISPDKTVSIFSHLSLYRRLWQVARNSTVDLGKQLGKLGTFSSVSPPTNRRIVTGSTEDHGFHRGPREVTVGSKKLCHFSVNFLSRLALQVQARMLTWKNPA